MQTNKSSIINNSIAIINKNAPTMSASITTDNQISMQINIQTQDLYFNHQFNAVRQTDLLKFAIIQCINIINHQTKQHSNNIVTSIYIASIYASNIA
jgi:hypothetical protein